ncbi:hypothetical protein WJ542_14925 [Paraburkholderia sp. B3]|uniref:hypothetical protein n=1 Tax=Paraburkholderia sp. B3 TaxID=3134791 RepID=UPI003982B80F
MEQVMKSSVSMKVLAVAVLGVALLFWLKYRASWLDSGNVSIKVGSTYAISSVILACPTGAQGAAPSAGNPGASAVQSPGACLTLQPGTRIKVLRIDAADNGARAVVFNLPDAPAQGELWSTDAPVAK